MIRAMTDGVGLGPILMGVAKPAHVLTPAATVRRDGGVMPGGGSPCSRICWFR